MTNQCKEFWSDSREDYQLLSVGWSRGNGNLSKAPINLILLDVNMPDMDGLMVLRKIKEQDEEIDVIMISALNQAERLSMPSNWALMIISPAL